MTKTSIIAAGLLFSQLSFAQQAVVKAYVSLNPAGDFVAQMKTITGSATMSGEKYSAKNIVIDLKSMTTGLDLRDEHGKNKYMEVGKYPEAVLIEAAGENGKGTGKLKFHGKEGPIAGTYKVLDGGKAILAEFKIKLSAFDIKEINYKGIGVEDDVKIEVTIPVTAATATPGAAKPTAAKQPTQPKKK